MTSKKIDRYRDSLRKMADEIQQCASAMEEQTCQPTGGQADGGLSNAPMHLADIGTDVSLQEVSGTLLDNERYLLREIHSALQRLDDGTFGTCETCGKPIGEERLQAIPYARTCIQCATVMDQDSDQGLDSIRVTNRSRFAADGRLEDGNSSWERDLSALNDDRGTSDFHGQEADIHAAGTAGGGTALGGLAGTNIGRGDPRVGDLERATGSGDFDAQDGFEQPEIVPLAGHAGGAIEGTPAGKRSATTQTGGNKRTPKQKNRSTKKRRES